MQPTGEPSGPQAKAWELSTCGRYVWNQKCEQEKVGFEAGSPKALSAALRRLESTLLACVFPKLAWSA